MHSQGIPPFASPAPAPDNNIPFQNAGCSFCPWVQSFDYLTDQADPVIAQQQQGPPTGPPPDFIPTEQPTPFAVDPGAIAGCLFSFTFMWLHNGQSFWAFPVFVGRSSLAGWRFQRGRWRYFGIDLREIRSFQCF